MWCSICTRPQDSQVWSQSETANMAVSHIPRTLAALRENGHIAAKVEHWNAYGRVRQDFCGWADILYFHPDGEGVTGVQVCAGSGHAAHRDKLLKESRLRDWVRGNARWAEIWSWSKKGAKGKRKTWQVRIEPVIYEDFFADSGKPAIVPAVRNIQ